MQASVRPSSPRNNSTPQSSSEHIEPPASSTPDDARGNWRPHPSTTTVGGGGRIAAASTRQRQPQAAARPPAPWQQGLAPPASNSPSKGTAALVVRGTGHGTGGDCTRGGQNTPDGGGFRSPAGNGASGVASTAAADQRQRQGQRMARGLGRDTSPVVRPKVSKENTEGFAGSSLSVDWFY